MIDRKVFFDQIRKSLFHGKLNKKQVEGIEAILDYWEKNRANLDIRLLAYILATAYHETARTMQPIYERGNRAYFNKYEPRTKIGKRLGNTLPGDGYRFRGRGFVQLTGRRNYAYAGRQIGVDLLKDPDKALELDNAVKILVEGMLGGWFTGKLLGQYVTPTSVDYVGARRVVNGQDRARLIAGYAKKFEEALSMADKPIEPVKTVEITTPSPKVKVGVKISAGLIGGLLTALAVWWKEIAEWIGKMF